MTRSIGKRNRFRYGTFIGLCTVGALTALFSSNCAAPTQIIVDIRAEKSLCDDKNKDPSHDFIRGTGVAVTTPDRVDDADLQVFEGSGCDDPPGDQIGLLTITPSGAKDAEVAIRVVSGVKVRAENCNPPDFKDCIVARRTVRFVENQTVPVTIIMGAKCLNRVCATNFECDPGTGACVPRAQIQEDGGIKPTPDSSTNPDSPIVEKDADIDTNQPPVDAGFDACSTCKGTCTNNTECTVNCGQNGLDCTNMSVCGRGITKCNIECGGQTSCTGTSCNNPGTCSFDCHGSAGSPRCIGIACASGDNCNIKCRDPINGGSEPTCNVVNLDGGKVNKVECTGAAVNCDDVNCTAGAGASCVRTCDVDAAACGLKGACTPAAGCTGWVDGGP